MRSWLRMTVKMKELPITDRPRERLKNIGVESLSNEELLSILLKTGTKDYSVKELSNVLLKQMGSLKNLKNTTYENLIGIKGIGDAKACLLLAALELGSRVNRELEQIKGIKIRNSEDIFKYYQGKLMHKEQEHFYCLYLNTNKRVIEEKLLFIGTINYSVIHPREIFKGAYLTSASAIVCVHNHPTGNVMPSKEDIEMTNRLIEVGALLGIKVVDHIIIGKNTYYSMFENAII